jgi:hypothetical protein
MFLPFLQLLLGVDVQGEMLRVFWNAIVFLLEIVLEFKKGHGRTICHAVKRVYIVVRYRLAVVRIHKVPSTEKLATHDFSPEFMSLLHVDGSIGMVVEPTRLERGLCQHDEEGYNG